MWLGVFSTKQLVSTILDLIWRGKWKISKERIRCSVNRCHPCKLILHVLSTKGHPVMMLNTIMPLRRRFRIWSVPTCYLLMIQARTSKVHPLLNHGSSVIFKIIKKFVPGITRPFMFQLQFLSCQAFICILKLYLLINVSKKMSMHILESIHSYSLFSCAITNGNIFLFHFSY